MPSCNKSNNMIFIVLQTQKANGLRLPENQRKMNRLIKQILAKILPLVSITFIE